MELIKPKEISGKIMTLLDEAEKKTIIVSPYTKLVGWTKMLNTFKQLKQKNIDVEFYIRADNLEGISEVKRIGFHPIQIPGLHTKLYINEKRAIVSSMNLLYSSDSDSLDIAFQTETRKEYDDLFEYYEKYIQCWNKKQDHFSKYDPNEWLNKLSRKLTSLFGSQVKIVLQDYLLEIKARNLYQAFIYNGKTNDLRMSGILSGKEFEFARNSSNLFDSKRISIELVAGKKGYYDTIWGTAKRYQSKTLNSLTPLEAEDVSDLIISFISAVEELKERAQ